MQSQAAVIHALGIHAKTFTLATQRRLIRQPPDSLACDIISECILSDYLFIHSLILYSTVIMKLIPFIATCCSASALALSIPWLHQVRLGNDAVAERYLVELGPGETRWIKEDEKWDLRRVRQLLWPSLSS